MSKASLGLALAAAALLAAWPALSLAMPYNGVAARGGLPSDERNDSKGAAGANPGDRPPSGAAADPEALYQQGVDELRAGAFKAAADDFQRVINVDPNGSVQWLMLGEAKSGGGDDAGAEKAFEKSVKLERGLVDARRELALSLIRLKQPDKAQVQLTALQQRATRCADKCSDAADLRAAIAAIQGALGPGPTSANTPPPGLSVASPQAGDGAYVRAISLVNERRWDEALTSLRQAETVFGPHPDILTYEGYVWRHKGDWARAETLYRQVLAIEPDHRGATEYYGELKVLEGDMAGARTMLATLDHACTFSCAEAEELRRWIDHGGDPAS